MNTIPPLSEAIRLGAMLAPQGKHSRKGTACALEAAMMAIGLPKDRWSQQEAVEVFPIMRCRVRCPLRAYVQQPVEEIIWFLNDEAGWTRERIADFVATIEPQEAAVGEEARDEAHVGS